MKAIIKEKLVHPSWNHKLVLEKTIIGTKSNIIDKVNEYILKRINDVRLIKVEKFHIDISNSNKKIYTWDYIPTYR